LPASIDAYEIASASLVGPSDLLLGTNQGALLRPALAGQDPAPVHAGKGRVGSIAVSPDGRRAAVQREPDPPRVIDPAIPATLVQVPGHHVELAAFDPDGRPLTAGRERTRWTSTACARGRSTSPAGSGRSRSRPRAPA
jgi:hypothetical protein